MEWRTAGKGVAPAAILVLASFGSMGAGAPEWEDPSMIGINKAPAHASITPWPDEANALDGERLDRVVRVRRRGSLPTRSR